MYNNTHDVSSLTGSAEEQEPRMYVDKLYSHGLGSTSTETIHFLIYEFCNV